MPMVAVFCRRSLNPNAYRLSLSVTVETTTSCDFYGGLVVQLENHEHAGEEVAEAFDQSHADSWATCCNA